MLCEKESVKQEVSSSVQVYEVKKADGTMWQFQEFSNFIQKLKNENPPKFEHLYNYVKHLMNSDQLEDDFTIVEVVFS